MKKTLLGTVVSSGKMDKTIVVKIMRRVVHPLYKKIINRASKLLVHDPENKYKDKSHIGQEIEIQEGRPFSKNKTWVVV